MRPASVLRLVLPFAATALVALVVTPATPATPDYVHGGISASACEVCHTDNHTNWPVASEKCLSCHTGYDAPDLPATCWTCHTPGQDMAAARTDAACTATCHLPDGETSVHSAHAGGSTACTTCHPPSPSIGDAGGSPHHDLPLPPAPTVARFTPSAGAPGTAVTVTGADFTRVIAIEFGGVRASVFAVVSDTEIRTVVPVGAATGAVAVVNAGGTGVSSAVFTVQGRAEASLTAAAAPATFRRGGRVTVTGKLEPATLAGARVSVSFQLKKGARWTPAATRSAVARAGGRYSCAWRPPKPGSYRVRATLPATAGHAAAASAWATFRVR